ncbi:hypothetical protein [Geomicrobium sediminis]|uniref:Uncharacterized protein n=1 Tax=Geomicrobium sediminis TaxID=1347788 RepID=A0ABS2PG89_9BACL|nr:hypothetical protein [Geomicrobium sediminis]
MDWLLLFGEMQSTDDTRVEDIPLAPSVDIEALKKGDEEPLEVVVSIPASKSTRGWNYSSSALKSIVNKVNQSTLAGFKGHQKPEDVSNQFLNPATHWIGAKMEGETAYFRGVVDSTEKDLKRWIRSGRIKQVSIFGRPKLQKANGQTNVVDYDAMSIDWTPLDRAGMQTSIVAMSGEMWGVEGEGPQDTNKGGNKTMNPEELLKELKKMYGNKQVTMTMIAGEMGLKAEDIAGELDQKWTSNLVESEKTLQQVQTALGVTGEMDVVNEAKKAAEALQKQSTEDVESMVGEMMTEKVSSDAVRKELNDEKTVLGRLWSYHKGGLKEGITKDELAAEMDGFLKQGIVAEMISKQHTELPAGTSFTDNKQTNTMTATRKSTTQL